MNTKEARAYIRSHMLSQKIGVDVASKLTAICDECDALKARIAELEAVISKADAIVLAKIKEYEARP